MHSRTRNSIISLISIALVVLLILSSLFLYTGNWPPAVIVESKSMQHGNNFVFGAINTGDIVAVKSISNFNNVDTYVTARENGGPKTYGEYGNVIIYKNGVLHELVIHRAIFYVDGWNGNVPEIYDNNNPSWLNISGSLVYISNVGYSHKNLVIDLRDYVGQVGFVTMGDYNFATSTYQFNGSYIASDQNVGIDDTLVSAAQVFGIAVGYLPIMGVFKLWITGNTHFIPPLSNEIMAVIIVVAIALIFVPFPSLPNKGGKKIKKIRK